MGAPRAVYCCFGGVERSGGAGGEGAECWVWSGCAHAAPSGQSVGKSELAFTNWNTLFHKDCGLGSVKTCLITSQSQSKLRMNNYN